MPIQTVKLCSQMARRMKGHREPSPETRPGRSAAWPERSLPVPSSQAVRLDRCRCTTTTPPAITSCNMSPDKEVGMAHSHTKVASHIALQPTAEGPSNYFSCSCSGHFVNLFLGCTSGLNLPQTQDQSWPCFKSNNNQRIIILSRVLICSTGHMSLCLSYVLDLFEIVQTLGNLFCFQFDNVAYQCDQMAKLF